jgi:hypothetical protein
VRSCQIWCHHNILQTESDVKDKDHCKNFPPSGLSVLVMNYLNWFDIPIFKHRRNRSLNFTQRGARASFTASLGVKIGTSNKFK